MTTQPLLRIYREPTAEAPATDRDPLRATEPRLHPLWVVVFSAALHLAVLVAASIAAVASASGSAAASPFVPQHPMQIVFLGLLLAQCGIGAVALARRAWPIYIKLLAAAALSGTVWLLVLAVLEAMSENLAAAGWLMSLATQTIVVWLGATAVDFCVAYHRTAAATRFHLLHLVLVTTIAAVLLGGGRVAAERNGFTLADIPNWQFLQPVLLAAVTSAMLAVGTHAILQWRSGYRARLLLSSVMLLIVAFAAPVLFMAVFGKQAGASLVELRWLFGSEGLFLVATLVPLQILREYSAIGLSHMLK